MKWSFWYRDTAYEITWPRLWPRKMYVCRLEAETKTIMDLETAQILHFIESLQDVQKKNPPSSEKWQEASKALEPLLQEMARRTK